MLAGHQVVMRRGSTPTLMPLLPPGSRKWEASSQAKEGAALASFCCDKRPAMEDLKGKGLFWLLGSKGLVYGELAPLLLGLHEAEGQGREQYTKAYLEADRRQIEQNKKRPEARRTC